MSFCACAAISALSCYGSYDRIFDSIEELITFGRDSRFEAVIRDWGP